MMPGKLNTARDGDRPPPLTYSAGLGSLAHSDGDRWSDLDLTFGVVDGVSIREVLDDFTADLIDKFQAAHLFDLPNGSAI